MKQDWYQKLCLATLSSGLNSAGGVLINGQQSKAGGGCLHLARLSVSLPNNFYFDCVAGHL